MDVPGTKTTSQYRGVSWNKAIGQWMAVVWNFQERKTQIVGNYATEIEVRKRKVPDTASEHSTASGIRVFCPGSLQLANSTMS